MRIFQSQLFLASLINLPKKTQGKVLAFMEKLKKNPTSLGLHIEPIAQFYDSSIRTARVDDNYRVVLGVQDGDNYILQYVSTHEDAYNWGKRKKCFFNDYTDCFQLITVEERTEVVSVSSDPDVKPFFKDVPEEKLLRIGVPLELMEPVMQIVTLDDLDRLSACLPEDVFENLFNVLDGIDIDIVISEVEEGKMKGNGDKFLSDNNRRRYVEITDDENLQSIFNQSIESWQIFLHPMQRRLVETNFRGTMKVSGGAGTGKTIAAIHRLNYLCKSPNANVLFTTFTTTLSLNLAPLIEKMNVPTQRYTLNNIDKVLADIAAKYGVMPGFKVMDYFGTDEPAKLWHEVLEGERTEFDERFLRDEYVDVILNYNNKELKKYLLQRRPGRAKALTRKQRLEVWRIVEKYVALKQERKLADRLELFNAVADYLKENDIHPYTNVIADEFQDFSNPELRFLRALVAKGRNDLFLTGDPIQRIFTGRSINFGVAGINVRGVRSVKLRVNYRTTEQIKRVAVNVVSGMDFDDMNGGVEAMNGYVSLIRTGIEPQYKMVADASAEVQQVVDWLEECKNSDIQLSEICVAAPSLTLLKDLQTRLHGDGVDYKLIKGAQRQGSSKGVSLCTFHSLKGLEYRAVILMGVNERNLPSKVVESNVPVGVDALGQKAFLSSKRSLLYVAITRARQLVFMVGYGEPTGLLKITE